jgi:hypothetical protein
MAEFWRALRTLRALQAEQARNTDAALAASPIRTAPRPPLVHRPRPNEPECGDLPEPEYLPSEPAAPPRTLQEPAVPWQPNEPASVRHAASVPASRMTPQAAPKRDPTLRDENCANAECPDIQTNPMPQLITERPAQDLPRLLNGALASMVRHRRTNRAASAASRGFSDNAC